MTSPSGKIYIGQTSQTPSVRWGYGYGYINCPHLFSAIKKYGWDNFEHIIVTDNLSKREADWIEHYLICYYESYNKDKGYNLTMGGDGAVGYRFSDEQRKAMSLKRKGRKATEETKARLSYSHKHCLRTQLVSKKVVQRNKKNDIIDIYDSITDASKALNVDIRDIWNVCNGRQKTCRNYIFEYEKK